MSLKEDKDIKVCPVHNLPESGHIEDSVTLNIPNAQLNLNINIWLNKQLRVLQSY